MKIKKKFYSVGCDRCGADMLHGEEISGWSDFDYVLGMIEDYYWEEVGDKHYCPDCYYYNDDDELVIKPKEDEEAIGF